MGDAERLSACEPGTKLSEMGCERGGLRRGLCRISPKAKSKNILFCPAGLRGLLGVICCSDAAVRLIASVIRAMQVVRTACHLGYTVLPQPQYLQKYAGKQNCVRDHTGL